SGCHIALLHSDGPVGYSKTVVHGIVSADEGAAQAGKPLVLPSLMATPKLVKVLFMGTFLWGKALEWADILLKHRVQEAWTMEGFFQLLTAQFAATSLNQPVLVPSVREATQPVPVTSIEGAMLPLPVSGMENTAHPDPVPVPGIVDTTRPSPFPVPSVRDITQPDPVSCSQHERHHLSCSQWDVGLAKGVEHHIRLSDIKPFREQSRRLAPNDTDDVQKHLEELMKSSLYTSPIVSCLDLVYLSCG
ncbi:hypothetical protein P4O66_015369, partial [Electrophorus voltai]